ncbi:MAG: D-sedoheptulose 7-phosphate isomerase [Athalassotoga sp.]|uniref:D-sedoheptulose 7-phosphate isomerase n=1 Tax=Athalassotoga sp. TaxID=2022597 RepID=UPI003D015645
MRIEDIKLRLLESANVKTKISQDKELLQKIMSSAVKMAEALKDGKKILVCGNGGSAADAQHIAAELVGKFMKERIALPAIALNTNTSVITAIGNDYSYDDIFSRQIEAFSNAGDILIGISTSGNSKNVLKAFEVAKQRSIMTIALTGQSGGKMKDMVDVLINVPSNLTPRIQEAHITIGHIMCEIIEEYFE